MPPPVIYLKLNRNSDVSKQDVYLEDVGKIYCSDQDIVNKIKTLKLFTIQAKKNSRHVCSVLKVIELIGKLYPHVEIMNLGEIDFIINYEKEKKENQVFGLLKTIFICLISFFGGAFAIMTFNTDVGVSELFSNLYEWMTGSKSNGFTILEISYSMGLSIGIIVFYNQFAGKKMTIDPTPIEVEMRLYENDVNTTLVEDSNRMGTSIDVD